MDRDHRGEIAPRAVTGDHQPCAVDVQRQRVVRDPLRRRDRVLDRGRKFVFRREPVVD